MGDQRRLAGYIDVGRGAIDELLGLLESLAAEEWSTPTDLPGWDVRAVAAHVAHIESVLAGLPQPEADAADGEPMLAPSPAYTERGVVARSGCTPEEIIAEIRLACRLRFEALDAEPPVDGSIVPETAIPTAWTWNTLLRNRPLDVWMHEQDIRRAVARPGGLDSPAALHTVRYYAEGVGFVAAKRAAAEPGTTVVLELDDAPPIAFEVTAERRGVPLSEVPDEPTVRLSMDRESFIVLSGGRRAPAPGAVSSAGDLELAERILGALNTTP